MRIISKEETAKRLPYDKLIPALRDMFCAGTQAPLRHHHSIKENGEAEATLLLMPAWSSKSGFGGVKLVNVNPANNALNLPSINASYLLFNTKTGAHLCLLDGGVLTSRRTAAASALAASFLARPDSTRLLVVGAGKVGNELPFAYKEVLPIEEVIIWDRTPDNMEKMVKSLTAAGLNARAATSLEEGVKSADIISCATLATDPIIRGEWLSPGQHLDLIGSFTPAMREADDLALSRAKIFVDTQAATLESGELRTPLASGVISENDIGPSLYQLCAGPGPWRARGDITAFKAVGHAIEDLAAATLVYKALS